MGIIGLDVLQLEYYNLGISNAMATYRGAIVRPFKLTQNAFKFLRRQIE